jgi:proteasome accessory factor B
MWYLVGHDLGRRAMRTFALPRMSGFKLTKRGFARDPGFLMEKYFGDSFWMLSGEGTRRVRIVFDAHEGSVVRERFWHESQKFKGKPGGAVELELRVGHFHEVLSWVLSWGGSARVVEPPELARDVARAARRIAKAHAGRGMR